MAQVEYWKEHTSVLDGATVNAMMLDSQVRHFHPLTELLEPKCTLETIAAARSCPITGRQVDVLCPAVFTGRQNRPSGAS